MLRTTIPLLTRILLLLSLLLSIVVAVVRYSTYFSLTSDQPEKKLDMSRIYVGYLTIVPAVSIVFPWVFLISSLVEQNVVSLTITMAMLFYAGKYCERVWGTVELGRFLALVSVVPNLLVFIIYYVLFVTTGDESLEFITICGGVGIQAAFLVAFKQMVPEHTVILFRGIVKMRVKHLPALFLLMYTVFGVLGARISFLLAWSGFLTSWIYLRFYRVSTLDTLPTPTTASTLITVPITRGDASDTFSFAHFFPDIFSPVLTRLSDKAFALLLKMHICLPFSDEDIEGANARTGQYRQRVVGPLPGSVRAEAERRRAVALKALDQRMQNRPGSTGGTSYTPGE